MINGPSTQNSAGDHYSPHETANKTSTTTASTGEFDKDAAEENLKFGPSKRAKTSRVWEEFSVITISDGTKKAKCAHYKRLLSISNTSSTTHLGRHLKTCLQREIEQDKQKRINFQVVGEDDMQPLEVAPALMDGKFEMVKMREGIAHWILMHDHPFTIVEEDGYNMSQRRGIRDWEKISRNTIRKDCVQVYEIEKNKLKTKLKNISKISLTTDLWKSTNQKLGYMVVTGHFIDSSWKLQKRVLNFVRLPPPHRGIDIADSIFKCAKEWGIENKVYTISVDNASNNDSVIKILSDDFSRNRKLLCGGKLFHVQCCAHILNLLVQDGLSRIENIIEDIHESIRFINHSESRLMVFSEIVQQLQLPHRRLVLECKTRWNSTFEMLSTAIKFKEVFPRYKERETRYSCCSSDEDWLKVEKICSEV